MIDEVSQNKDKIIELLSNAYGYDSLLAAMKECHFLLRKTAQLIEDDELQHSWNPKLQNISDIMPCLLCNGHYSYASEYARGIRYEPVVNEGKVFLCWECVHGLNDVIHGQFSGMAYNFLFSLGKDVVELRKNYAKLQEPEEKTLYQELVALYRKAKALSQEFENIGERHQELLDNFRVWTIRQTLEMVPGAIEGLAEEYEEKKA